MTDKKKDLDTLDIARLVIQLFEDNDISFIRSIVALETLAAAMSIQMGASCDKKPIQALAMFIQHVNEIMAGMLKPGSGHEPIKFNPSNN